MHCAPFSKCEWDPDATSDGFVPIYLLEANRGVESANVQQAWGLSRDLNLHRTSYSGEQQWRLKVGNNIMQIVEDFFSFSQSMHFCHGCH